MMLLLIVAVGGFYGGMLIDKDGKLTDVTRPLLIVGVPVVFLLAAVKAYRRGTKARVLSTKPAPLYFAAQQRPVVRQHGDAWSPRATAGATGQPAASSLAPPWTPVLDVEPPPDGPRLPPRT